MCNYVSQCKLPCSLCQLPPAAAACFPLRGSCNERPTSRPGLSTCSGQPPQLGTRCSTGTARQTRHVPRSCMCTGRRPAGIGTGGGLLRGATHAVKGLIPQTTPHALDELCQLSSGLSSGMPMHHGQTCRGQRQGADLAAGRRGGGADRRRVTEGRLSSPVAEVVDHRLPKPV